MQKPAGKKVPGQYRVGFPMSRQQCLNRLFKVSICLSFLSLALMKYPNRKQHRERNDLIGLYSRLAFIIAGKSVAGT